MVDEVTAIEHFSRDLADRLGAIRVLEDSPPQLAEEVPLVDEQIVNARLIGEDGPVRVEETPRPERDRSVQAADPRRSVRIGELAVEVAGDVEIPAEEPSVLRLEETDVAGAVSRHLVHFEVEALRGEDAPIGSTSTVRVGPNRKLRYHGSSGGKRISGRATAWASIFARVISETRSLLPV